MSQFRRLSRPFLALGLGAAAVVGSSEAAHAATVSVARDAVCSLPIVGPQPLKVTVEADLPEVVAAGSSQPSSSATVTLDWGAASPFQTLAAAASGTVSVAATPALTTPQTTDFRAAKQTLVGSFAAFKAPDAAGTKQWAFADGGIALTVRFADASGRILEVSDPEFAPDTDNDPQTSNVRCTWRASTSPLIHVTQVTAPPVPAQVNVKLKCGAETATLRLSGFPPALPVGYDQGIRLSGDVTFDSPSMSQLLKAARATSIEGTSAVALSVRLPSAAVLDPSVRSTIARSPIDEPLVVPLEGTTPSIRFIDPGTVQWGLGGSLVLTIVARDSEGEPVAVPGEDGSSSSSLTVECSVDPLSPPLNVSTLVGDACAPTGSLPGSSPCPQPVPAPRNLTASRVTDTSVDLAWTSDAQNIKHHDAVCGNTSHFLVSEPRVTVTGLQPGTEYKCTVRTVDNNGNVSEPAAITVRTVIVDFVDTPFAFGSVTGAVALKSLASGSLPLTGSLDFKVGWASTAIKSGELKLNPTKANLKALGFVPVTARVEFANVGGLSGSLTTEGKLAAKQQLRLKLPEIRAFGIVLGGGANCQTRSATTVKLESDTSITQAGGSLIGTFPISNLSGCGVLNGLVSPLTSSTGNTIRLVLKP